MSIRQISVGAAMPLHCTHAMNPCATAGRPMHGLCFLPFTLSRRTICRLIIALHLIITAYFASPARADGYSPSIIGISRSSQSVPRYSTWAGSAWSASSTALSVGEIQSQIVTRNCPTRNETAMATLDYQNDINLQFFKSGSWTGQVELCTDAGTSATRCFDVAYEQISGKMLIAFWNNLTQKLIYRTYNGTTLSAATSITLSNTSNVTWVRLVARPESNEIAAVFVNGSKHLYAMIWNGTSFGTITTLHTNLNTSSEQCFDAAYEALSGRLLVAYAISSSNNPRYRIRNGSTWTSEASMPSIGGVGRWLRLEADPASNQTLFGATENNKDLNVNAWSGTAWGSNQELENEACWDQLRAFDIAYEGGGTRALIVYPDNWNNRFRYRTWNGSSWSAEAWGHNLGDTPCLVQLRTGLQNGEVFLAVHNNSSRLNACRWSGSGFSSNQVVESNMQNAWGKECYMIAVPVGSSLLPADVPYANDFESSMGAEWSDATLTSNSTLTQFAGRFHSDKLKLALNTTPGETYTLAFDFYAIDSWDGSTSENSAAPDYFSVSAGSTQIFNHTLTHEWPTAQGGSYPYPYDQIGHFGFNEAYKDAIYRKVQVAFTATDSVTTLTFQAALTDENNAGLDDESWGIDNISVDLARFVDVSTATGFAFNTSTSAVTYGSGMAWADIDNDGDLDCVISGSTGKLVINANAGQSFAAGSFPFNDFRAQTALLDVDNDGDLDIWTPALFGNTYASCAQNNGNASFSHPGNLGFHNANTNMAAATADVNADGWPDVVMFSTNGNWIGFHQGTASPIISGTTHASYGLNNRGDFGLGDYCSTGDINNDGRVDFFYHCNNGRLFVSNGDGTFTQNSRYISVVTDPTKKFGSAWADYDNDGDLDLFCSRMDEACTGYLWRNDCFTMNGFTGNFTDVTTAAGFTINTVIDYGPDKPGTRSVAWGDYDNDGDLDVFVLGAAGAHYLYENQGNHTFKRVASGITAGGVFIDCCFVDYDNDGDLDLAMTRENGTSLLYGNRTNNSNYLKVRIVGRGAGGTPKDAVGTRVELWNAAGTSFVARRDIGVARGYGGTEPQWAHFGGVAPNTAYQLKVYFATTTVVKPVTPASATTTIGSRTIPQMITVTETSPAMITKWKEPVNKPAT